MKFLLVVKKGVLDILRTFKHYRAYSFIPRRVVYFNRLSNVTVLSLNEPAEVKRQPPFTIDDEIYWKFKNLLIDIPQKTFVVEAIDWRVWGNQGAVVTSNDELFKDVSREFEKPDHSIFKQVKLVPPRRLPGLSAVITTSGADMYYHWMFDILPRIKLLKDADHLENIDHYIIDFRNINFQVEALATLKIDLSKISVASDHFKYHVLAEKLLVPSLPSKLDVVTAEACRFLVDNFLNPKLQSKFGSMIYLKRTAKRKLINETEIENHLANLGFDTIECENYTIAEQASIFHNANVVIGTHGAAFTNVVFCKPGTKVIEFFSPHWINPCYWTICNEVKLKYYYLIGEGAAPDEHSNAEGTNADIELNIDKLLKLISTFELVT